MQFIKLASIIVGILPAAITASPQYPPNHANFQNSGMAPTATSYDSPHPSGEYQPYDPHPGFNPKYGKWDSLMAKSDDEHWNVSDVGWPHEKRDTKWLGIYECSDAHFKGKCIWTPGMDDPHKCYNIQLKMLNTQRGSLGPDGCLECNFFDTYDCKGSQASGYIYPGVPDYTVDKLMNDRGFWWGPMSVNCTLRVQCAVADVILPQ